MLRNTSCAGFHGRSSFSSASGMIRPPHKSVAARLRTKAIAPTIGAGSRTEIIRRSPVIGGRELVHCVDHRAGVLRWRRLQDAVTEIEHVAAAVSVAAQHGLDLRADAIGLRQQDARVEIA